jgi:hypothetical protein
VFIPLRLNQCNNYFVVIKIKFKCVTNHQFVFLIYQIGLNQMSIPTPEDAALFAESVKKWQQVLNLSDWRIEKGLNPAKQAMASVEFNEGARLATYRLGDFGAEKITRASLDSTALHELLHVFLHDLLTASQDPKSSPEEVEKQEHRVINLLERLLAKDSNGFTN